MRKIVVVTSLVLVIAVLGGCGSKSSGAAPSSKETAPIDVVESVPVSETTAPSDPVPDVNVSEAASPEVSEEVVPEKGEDSEYESMTMSQKNAVKSALNYLQFSPFSHNGLVAQLSSEYGDNYPKEDAEFAVSYLEDNGKVDWNEQAVKAAKNYLEFSSFSREGLIDQLCSEYGDQYTREQAEYAVDQVGY